MTRARETSLLDMIHLILVSLHKLALLAHGEATSRHEIAYLQRLRQPDLACFRPLAKHRFELSGLLIFLPINCAGAFLCAGFLAEDGFDNFSSDYWSEWVLGAILNDQQISD